MKSPAVLVGSVGQQLALFVNADDTCGKHEVFQEDNMVSIICTNESVGNGIVWAKDSQCSTDPDT